jgi:putative Mg2+ transporter-C (MgtC) family protein
VNIGEDEMPGDLEIILRLILASILGGVIGLEREVHGREAGVRTTLLVCLGSALFMVISESFFFKYESKVPGGPFYVDPVRLAAQVVTGVGFLGAGVIIRMKESIRGVTTAASIWVVCAVGLAVGSGYYFFGVTTSVIAILSLIGLKALEKRLRKDWYKEIVIVSEDKEGQLNRIQEVIDRYEVKVIGSGLRKDFQKKEMTANFRLRVHAIKPDQDLLKEVFELEGIKRVDIR